MTPLERRAAAAQATLDEYRKRPFRLGRDDCLTMAQFHMKQLGIDIDLGVRPYKTVAQAKAELKRLHAAHVGELLSPHFEKIPPAATIVGDLIAMEGQRGLGGLAVVLGNGRIVAYHEDIADHTADVLQPHEYLGAWRVPV